MSCYFVDPCNDCPANSTGCEPQSDGSVVCLCPPGYNGSNCGNYIGFCRSDPCLNGGTCTEIINNFTCTCANPLTGRLCEIDLIDDCDPDPCMNNGTCIDDINGFTCNCTSPWIGDICDVDGIDNCTDVDCNNGSRVDLSGKRTGTSIVT